MDTTPRARNKGSVLPWSSLKKRKKSGITTFHDRTHSNTMKDGTSNRTLTDSKHSNTSKIESEEAPAPNLWFPPVSKMKTSFSETSRETKKTNWDCGKEDSFLKKVGRTQWWMESSIAAKVWGRFTLTKSRFLTLLTIINRDNGVSKVLDTPLNHENGASQNYQTLTGRTTND